MNNLRKLLPALALVLGAFAAMAMNLPNFEAERSATKIWTPDSSHPDGYREVTAIVQGNDYQCNQSSMDCLVEFSNDDPATGIPNILSQGVFVEL
ncbi:MAG: hypothetical protein P8O16_09705 [Algoriphagus sp.]|jgi:hypothetical protein|uniref:hypothetical protein n=1 Tax=Algoriphagus sp. TaxID=1872435 RepID=UPI002614A2F8|nr:hypothetical protein [Algoriphagus sp.]MDG1277543.1 hypothetical protein [Algoriphagus sp.]